MGDYLDVYPNDVDDDRIKDFMIENDIRYFTVDVDYRELEYDKMIEHLKKCGYEFKEDMDIYDQLNRANNIVAQETTELVDRIGDVISNCNLAAFTEEFKQLIEKYGN